MKLRPPSTSNLTCFAKIMPFWEHEVVKLMELNEIQIPPSYSPQASFSPSSDAHSESKKQPVGSISAAARFKICTRFISEHFTSTFNLGAQEDANVANRKNVHCLVSVKRRHKKVSPGRAVFWKVQGRHKRPHSSVWIWYFDSLSSWAGYRRSSRQQLTSFFLLLDVSII